MSDPFLIDSPTCLSFSGGSTSGYMLWRVLQANPRARLDKYLRVAFANTGLEDEKTLEFVRACQTHWGFPVEWVEYRDDEAGHAVVDFETASRAGEPFLAIVRKRNYLPNPITRFCTSELKIRTMHKRLKALGWHDELGEWEQCVGIRADEPRRVAKIRARGRSSESAKETMRMPLADAGVAVAEVDGFWERQPFKLELPRYRGRTLAGNCVLCFLKPKKQIQSLIAEDPARAVIWMQMETSTVETIKPRFVDTGFVDERGEPLLKQLPPDGAFFRNDRPNYTTMHASVTAQADAFGYAALDEEEALPCFCGE